MTSNASECKPFTNVASFQFSLCLSEVLEIATKPVNYMEIHTE